MEKILKSYFLFFSRHPIQYNFVIGALAFSVMLVKSILYTETSSYLRGEYLGDMLVNTRIWIGIALLINVVLIYIVKAIWISDLDKIHENVLFQVLIINGKKVILKKPTWGKGRRFLVLIKNSRTVRPSRNVYQWFTEIETSVLIKLKYENLEIDIPIVIKSSYYDLNDLNKMELFEALIKRDSSEILIVDSHIESIFKELNPVEEKIEKVVAEYVKVGTTASSFLNDIANSLVVPEEILPGIGSLKISIKDPIIESFAGKR